MENINVITIEMRAVLVVLLCAGLIGVTFGCRREEGPAQNGPTSDPGPPERVGVVVFPEDLLVEDASVNEFLRDAMTVCTTGDYDAFRLLWSARHEPLARDEFERGWQAVLEIRIRALEKVVLAPDAGSAPAKAQMVYATCANVRLDPNRLAKEQEPRRQVVLMLVREHDKWRLAWAPKNVQAWLKEKVLAASDSASNMPEREEPGPEPGG